MSDAAADLANLEALCADRPAQKRELFEPNTFYGHDLIIKAYAGLSEQWLPCVLPHGITLRERFVWQPEVHNPLPEIWCCPSYRERAYRQAAPDGKRVVRAASPYLYALSLAGPAPARRAGTIVFPSHSTHHITAQLDYEHLAERLVALDAELQPVTVCLYWRDYNLGHAAPFRRRGLRVVSAGHMFDPQFLFRFHALCSAHRYAASDDPASCMFYAVKSGCSFFLLPGFKTEYEVANNAPRPEGDDGVERRRHLSALFSEPASQPTAEQRALVDDYLGADAFWTREQMRAQLLRAFQEMRRSLVRVEGRRASMP